MVLNGYLKFSHDFWSDKPRCVRLTEYKFHWKKNLLAGERICRVWLSWACLSLGVCCSIYPKDFNFPSNCDQAAGYLMAGDGVSTLYILFIVFVFHPLNKTNAYASSEELLQNLKADKGWDWIVSLPTKAFEKNQTFQLIVDWRRSEYVIGTKNTLKYTFMPKSVMRAGNSQMLHQ